MPLILLQYLILVALMLSLLLNNFAPFFCVFYCCLIDCLLVIFGLPHQGQNMVAFLTIAQYARLKIVMLPLVKNNDNKR